MARGRITKWFTTLRGHQALATGSQLTFDLLVDMSASQTQGATVTRILFDLYSRNDGITQPKVMDWGIVLMAGEAASAGAFPEADDEDERVDWMGRGRMMSTMSSLGDGAALGRVSRDLRAQRVIRDEFQQLRLILDLDAVAAGGILVTFITRVLVKMP